MRLIDADALKRELRGLYHPYSDELYRVESVIDRMTPAAFPPRIEWDDCSSGKDDYHRGYMAGWNMYLTTIENQVVKGKETKQ